MCQFKGGNGGGDEQIAFWVVLLFLCFLFSFEAGFQCVVSDFAVSCVISAYLVCVILLEFGDRSKRVV